MRKHTIDWLAILFLGLTLTVVLYFKACGDQNDATLPQEDQPTVLQPVPKRMCNTPFGKHDCDEWEKLSRQ